MQRVRLTGSPFGYLPQACKSTSASNDSPSKPHATSVLRKLARSWRRPIMWAPQQPMSTFRNGLRFISVRAPHMAHTGSFNKTRPQIEDYKMKISFAVTATIAMLAASGASPAADSADTGAAFSGATTNIQFSRDPAGAIATYNANGPTDTRGAFFQSLGINGRSCATCHAADQALSISPPQIRERFYASRGRDPLFAAVDGANCTNASAADPAAHSLLLKHGLIRVARVVPANAEFTLSVAHDPYGCALAVDPASGGLTASVYRRPLPTSNLRFLSVVMWDGRETVQPLTTAATFVANLQTDLTHQAQSAITTHARATQLATAAQLADIVKFELGLSTAQIWDRSAGMLDSGGATGGPRKLAGQIYYPGINDVLGADPT